MELKKLLKEQPTEVEAEYRPGFVVRLRYLPRKLLARAEREVVKVYRGGQLEDKGLLEILSRAVVQSIVDWRGLTPRLLYEHFNLDIDLDGIDPNIEIPCTEENKKTLVESDSEFETWVWRLVSDVRAMRNLEGELKN